MPRGREIKVVIEKALEEFGVTRYSFDHAMKHNSLTWWLNGHVKFITFGSDMSDHNLKNTRADIRRYCRQMLAQQAGKVGLS